MTRHPSIKHWRELQEPEPGRYSGSQEPLSQGSALGRHYGFARLGIHHELLPPGRRTSWPHAEETEDEFVHVLEGTPDVWLDGVLHRLQPGDSVGFKAGDGLATPSSTIPISRCGCSAWATPIGRTTTFTTPCTPSVTASSVSGIGMRYPSASWGTTTACPTSCASATAPSRAPRPASGRQADTTDYP